MINFKRTLALGLALAVLSQVSYASSPLEYLKEAASKPLPPSIAPVVLDQIAAVLSESVPKALPEPSIPVLLSAPSAPVPVVLPPQNAPKTVFARVASKKSVKPNDKKSLRGKVRAYREEIKFLCQDLRNQIRRPV